ncbi:hypothetical protein [Mangrovibacter phragmitis]|uniref:glycine-rich domain-containing protein n=1 Tax=Mangrovibacter phragmitis TaxID=1691903 RepID=UPI00336A03C5
MLASNNASTVLAAGISASATSLTVASGTGALFPTPVSGTSYFKLSLIDAATGTLLEVVHVTAVSGDTFTITRAQEGTAARIWSANDLVINTFTAGSFNALAQLALSLQINNNLSDLASIPTALANLGLGGSHGIQTITTSTSFTVPDNIYDLYISASGAGGGGGGGYSSSYSGSGGGGGASIYRQHFSVTPGTVLSVVIGSGGAGGAVGIAGYSGGATSVGSLFSLAGGGGGNPGISGAGGNSAGLPGGVGSVAGEDAFNNVPGGGGGNLLGVGGVKRAAAGGAGIYGGGGAGGYSGNAGGAGGDGVVIIEWER